MNYDDFERKWREYTQTNDFKHRMELAAEIAVIDAEAGREP
jgi:hypothetical protein